MDMATTKGSPRATKEWRRIAEAVKRRDGYRCVNCGRGREDGTRLHADHVVRLADGGDPYDTANVQTLCHVCHLAKTRAENTTNGNRIRNRDRYRAAQGLVRNLDKAETAHPITVPTVTTEPEPDTTPHPPIPLVPLTTPHRPTLESDGVGEAHYHFAGVPPRFATPVPYGADTSESLRVEGFARDHLSLELRDWQRRVLFHALAKVPDPSEPSRMTWAFPVVVVLTPRQVGKSVILRTLATYWAASGLTALHVANRLTTAREVWAPAARWAADRGAKVLRTSDQPEIILDTRHPERAHDVGRYMVQASKPNAGMGFTVDRALVDEAWCVGMEVATQGIQPAMSSVPDPQLWLFSTAGDDTSDLLRHYRDAGITGIRDGNSRVCLLEWSAPETADWTDPDVWQAASPHWDTRRAGYVTEQRDLIPEGVFRSQYLNQWQVAVSGWVPPTTWASATQPEGVRWQPTAAIAEQGLDGATHAVVLAGQDDVGIVRTAFHHLTDVRDVERLLAETRAPDTFVTPSYAGRLTTRYPFVGQREMDPAMRTTADLLGRRAVTHPDDPRLSASVLAASARVPHNGTGQTLGAPAGTALAPARAWVWAVWLAAKQRTRPVIVSRSGPRRRST